MLFVTGELAVAAGLPRVHCLMFLFARGGMLRGQAVSHHLWCSAVILSFASGVWMRSQPVRARGLEHIGCCLRTALRVTCVSV